LRASVGHTAVDEAGALKTGNLIAVGVSVLRALGRSARARMSMGPKQISAIAMRAEVERTAAGECTARSGQAFRPSDPSAATILGQSRHPRRT
jgi:hypothetical protein